MRKQPKRKTYSMKLKNVIKKLYVEDGISAKEISKLKKSYPAHQTITGWATRKDKVSGLSWRDERDQRRIDHYNSIAPQAQVSKALGKIDQILSKKNINTKDFDALSKIQKFLKEITDWRYHAPMIFQALTRYMKFVDENYPQLVNSPDKDFLISMKHFKNELINELEDVEFKGINVS